MPTDDGPLHSQNAPPVSRDWLTKGAAAYPEALNRYLAIKLIKAAGARDLRHNRDGEGKEAHQEAAGVDNPVTDHTWRWVSKLRPQPQDARAEENAHALGGMRHPARAVDRLLRARHVGNHIRQLLEGFLGRLPSIQDRCLVAVGSEDPQAGPTEAQVVAARQILARYLDVSDIGGVQSELYETNLREGLISASAKKAGDVDSEAASWLRLGAPAGITALPQDCGVFPLVCTDEDLPNEEQLDRVGAGYDPEEGDFLNYRSVEDSPAATEEINRHMGSGYVRTFSMYEECRDWLGELPRPSKLALLVKVREGKTKNRLILDCRRGPDGSDERGVNTAA